MECSYFWGPVEKKIKTMLFHQYSWNSEVETTWISLIGWPYKTSNLYPNWYSTTEVMLVNTPVSKKTNLSCTISEFWRFFFLLHFSLSSFMHLSFCKNVFIPLRTDILVLMHFTSMLVFGCWRMNHVIYLRLRQK